MANPKNPENPRIYISPRLVDSERHPPESAPTSRRAHATMEQHPNAPRYPPLPPVQQAYAPHPHHLPQYPPPMHAHHPMPMHVTVPVPAHPMGVPHAQSQPPPPAQHYYDHHYAAIDRVASLEGELDKAHREIDRLRGKLAEYEKERSKTDSPKAQSRYWTPDEHKRFLEALQKFGAKDVRAVANYVGSRNATQVRTHAQKYFLRVARENKVGSALQSARKRSMSESDLARVGRSVRTPPGSPVMRDSRPQNGLLYPQNNMSFDSQMAPLPTSAPPMHMQHVAPLMSSLPPSGAASHMHQPQQPQQQLPSNQQQLPAPMQSTQQPQPLAMPSTLSSLSAPPLTQNRPPQSSSGMQHDVQEPPTTAAKPPVAVPSKLSDNTGINLLSIIASERKMEVDKNSSR